MTNHKIDHVEETYMRPVTKDGVTIQSGQTVMVEKNGSEYYGRWFPVEGGLGWVTYSHHDKMQIIHVDECDSIEF